MIGLKILTVSVPREPTKPTPPVSAVTYNAYTDPLGIVVDSVLNLSFVQPDGFDYFAQFGPQIRGAIVLPDTSVLAWAEGASQTTGGVKGAPATASYLVTAGPPRKNASEAPDPLLTESGSRSVNDAEEHAPQTRIAALVSRVRAVSVWLPRAPPSARAAPRRQGVAPASPATEASARRRRARRSADRAAPDWIAAPVSIVRGDARGTAARVSSASARLRAVNWRSAVAPPTPTAARG